VIGREARQQRIREILARNEIQSQEQLLDLLAADNIPTTQATLSRDLRDIGAVRGPRGYVIRATSDGETLDTKALERALRPVLRGVERGGALVVLRTEPGHAQPVAHEIDRAQLPQVIGTIAGYDAVFVATGSSGEARELLRLLRAVMGRR
jgi:transcriptional regulator of arginine metabolism